jgi:hypothetical protein
MYSVQQRTAERAARDRLPVRPTGQPALHVQRIHALAAQRRIDTGTELDDFADAFAAGNQRPGLLAGRIRAGYDLVVAQQYAGGTELQEHLARAGARRIAVREREVLEARGCELQRFHLKLRPAASLRRSSAPCPARRCP